MEFLHVSFKNIFLLSLQARNHYPKVLWRCQGSEIPLPVQVGVLNPLGEIPLWLLSLNPGWKRDERARRGTPAAFPTVLPQISNKPSKLRTIMVRKSGGGKSLVEN